MNSPFQVQLRSRADDTVIVEQLLLRYPAISASELATLIEIFPKLPLIDTALMNSCPSPWRRFTRIMGIFSEHRSNRCWSCWRSHSSPSEHCGGS